MDQGRLAQWQRAVEGYKRDINLVAFAASRGFELCPDKSTRRTKVLKHANGDRIVVSKNAADQHWVYYSVGDDRDSGTIVDFLLKREAEGMREVHAACREHLGQPRADREEFRVVPSDSCEVNRELIAQRYVRARVAPSSRYLNARGIRDETLNDPRFKHTWRVDGRGNVLFPHRDEAGLVGYEVKNHGYTSFATHGTKTIWRSRGFDRDDRLIIAESAIDALSYHQLHRPAGARYASVGGNPGNYAIEQLRHSVRRLPPGAAVVLAVDHDAGGDRLVAQLKPALVAEARTVLRHSPATLGRDWNAVLQRRERPYIARIVSQRPVIDMGIDR